MGLTRLSGDFGGQNRSTSTLKKGPLLLIALAWRITQLAGAISVSREPPDRHDICIEEHHSGSLEHAPVLAAAGAPHDPAPDLESRGPTLMSKKVV